MENEKILCAFCGEPYTKEMLEVYNGTYGCETGCEYYRVEVICAKCGKTAYSKGEFGSYDSEEEKNVILEDEWQEILRKKPA